MQTLTIETPSPFIVRPGPVTVALVGCGGNGSQIAQALARIAVHLEAAGQPPLRIYLVDGDTVEAKNVGRQLFTPDDIGTNKAVALAERFNRLFGLRIEAVPQMATLDLLRKLSYGDVRLPGYMPQPTNGPLRLLIGAVDTVVARKSLHAALAERLWDLWLDCGNHDYSGQVALGNTVDAQRLPHAIRAGLCTYLPAPSLTDPEILEAAPARQAANCAHDIAANLQGLMVNTQVAAVAAVYLDRILVHRQISYFRTSFAQGAMSMRSLPVTPSALADVTARYQAHLQGRAQKRRKEAA